MDTFVQTPFVILTYFWVPYILTEVWQEVVYSLLRCMWSCWTMNFIHTCRMGRQVEQLSLICCHICNAVSLEVVVPTSSAPSFNVVVHRPCTPGADGQNLEHKIT